MRTSYHSIYISPHLDDVTLSCGGQIYAQTSAGRSVLVVTLGAGQPSRESLSGLAHRIHDLWGLRAERVAEVRRTEDLEACGVLGAEVLHWDGLEALYRIESSSGAPLYPTLEALRGRLHPAEADLVDELASRLSALPGHRWLVAPLGVGRHVDHRIARAAAERLRETRLAYYEDYPYVDHRFALRKTLGLGWGWRALRLSLPEAAIGARIEAACRYRSQLSTAFPDRQILERRIRRYVRRVGGERLWWPARQGATPDPDELAPRQRVGADPAPAERQ